MRLRAVVALLLAALMLPLCACQETELAYAEQYHVFYDDLTPDGVIKIESEPAGAEVYLVNGVGNYSSIGVTPLRFACQASGRPYAFLLQMEGCFDRRIDARPLPDNTEVLLRVRMHTDYASPLTGEPDLVPQSPYRTLPEERNFGYYQGLNHGAQPAGPGWRGNTVQPDN